MLKDFTNEEARQTLYKAGRRVSLLVCRSVIAMLSNSPSFVDGKLIITYRNGSFIHGINIS